MAKKGKCYTPVRGMLFFFFPAVSWGGGPSVWFLLGSGGWDDTFYERGRWRLATHDTTDEPRVFVESTAFPGVTKVSFNQGESSVLVLQRG
jgi:hypothetical protein